MKWWPSRQSSIVDSPSTTDVPVSHLFILVLQHVVCSFVGITFHLIEFADD